MVTEDPTVYYKRSIMGTFTVKLKVVATWEQAAPAAGKGLVQKTGHFSDSMKLQGGSRGLGVGGWGAGSVLLILWPHGPLAPGTRHGAETPKPWLWQGGAHAAGPGSPATSDLGHQVSRGPLPFRTPSGHPGRGAQSN